MSGVVCRGLACIVYEHSSTDCQTCACSDAGVGQIACCGKQLAGMVAILTIGNARIAKNPGRCYPDALSRM